MTASSYDAIILGAGHNGLVAGTYLAKAGKRVLVLERRHVIGGAAVTEEFVPGFRGSIFSYVMSILHPKIIRELELARFGLTVLPANDLFCPLYGEDYIVFSDDVRKTQASFARFSKKDAEIYPEFDKWLMEAVNVVRQMLFETPIDITRTDLQGMRETAGFVWRHRKIGRKFYRVLDLMTMSAYDLLSEWFESDYVKAVLAYYASIGTFAGPKSPGSAYVLMHHVMGEHEGAGGWGFVRGGMGAITQAIAQSGSRFGLEIKTERPIERVLVEGSRAVGVVTTNGEEYRAPVVVSNLNAKTLFTQLVERKELPLEFMREIEGYRTFSTAFKMNVACHHPPQYRSFRKEDVGFDYPTYVHVAPDIDYLERAYDDAKYGWYSAKPFVTPVVPTIRDDTLGPPGKHVVNLFGGHAPYQLKGGDWATEKPNFVKNVLATMDEFAPGWSSEIIDMQVLLAPDIEEVVALPQGHIFQGELAPDQIFFKRPGVGAADYRTPIQGLYLCGSSSHPGGGVSGIPGHNAAREILKDLKGRRG
ncbi:MAG TPA: NAD(P)/FAD-dependent oxidoreductase [Geminicoccus sp.]|jgi:phytoene dehydrogenase-like protein|uniref:phytoene desaturase family protein n=1 Tax=Geminicoccus sp. TaxID=2024832 RepID=UPI002E327417|nr:NAD(P)/FAD-dependent oxidoreductase [Geminicoccus sp.]HEX2528298.1 NAD(P)/FAD-dependent oxidoreductase [Geminicoccus sp.]